MGGGVSARPRPRAPAAAGTNYCEPAGLSQWKFGSGFRRPEVKVLAGPRALRRLGGPSCHLQVPLAPGVPWGCLPLLSAGLHVAFCSHMSPTGMFTAGLRASWTI